MGDLNESYWLNFEQNRMCPLKVYTISLDIIIQSAMKLPRINHCLDFSISLTKILQKIQVAYLYKDILLSTVYLLYAILVIISKK